MNLREAVYTKLNDAALLAVAPGGVHNTLAPLHTPMPYVVFQVVGSEVQWTLGARVSESYEVQVRVVAEGLDPEPIEAAKAEILRLLDDATLPVTEREAWVCRCIGEIPDYAESEPSGAIISHGGYRFRVILAGA